MYEEIKKSDQYYLLFFYMQIALSILFQEISAITISRRVRRLDWAHGLVAAFVNGCLMTLGILGIILLFKVLNNPNIDFFSSGGLEPKFIWETFSEIINGGALLFILLFSISKITKSLFRKIETFLPSRNT